jgi:hypothetical protein
MLPAEQHRTGDSILKCGGLLSSSHFKILQPTIKNKPQNGANRERKTPVVLE